MTDKQKEIIQKHWSNPLNIGGVQELQNRIPKMMDEYVIAVLNWLGKKENNFPDLYSDSEDVLKQFKEDKIK